MRLEPLLTRAYINITSTVNTRTPQKVHMSKLDLMAMIILLVGLTGWVLYEGIVYLTYVYHNAVRVQ